ncbi:hypothetical protein STENM327S_08570 [Streptomyces tendae]
MRQQMRAFLDGSGARPAEVSWDLARTDRPDAPTEETAESALLRLVVRDPTRRRSAGP